MLRPFYLLILFISIVSAHHRRSYPSYGTVVNLRIEGSNTTIFESPVFTWGHNITTPSGGTHECNGLNNHSNPQPGPTPSSALDDAARRSGFTFDGIFFTEFDDFFITHIGPDAQTSTHFWGILLNFQFTPVGGCQQEAKKHDNILWAFDAFNANAFLKLDGPTLVRGEKDVTFTVTDGTSGTQEISIPHPAVTYNSLLEKRPALTQNVSSSANKSVSLLSSGKKLTEDVHTMEPDDMFARHTVYEMKSILHRLRSDVDAKQEELRLMVGERYRDLLQASTTIINMSQTSDRVHKTIERMKDTVSTDHTSLSTTTSGKGANLEDTQLQVLQCLAAHLKLLLDAPEHLWRLLERKLCLHAAWLFLLSRVVHRSLSNENTEEGQNWIQEGIHVKERFPIIQRQWESISQFRTQISHRATLLLRDQSMSSQDVCSSLLSLHLLDSLPLSEALDVFLRQRSRTLQLLYTTINGTWDKASESKDGSERFERGNVRNVWNTIRSVLDVIIGTVGTARQVFREPNDGSSSMIGQVLSFTQNETKTSSLSPELSISTQMLLSSLPNSNQFLPLPTDIRSYRPYIDLDSPSSSVKQTLLNSRLRDWFSKESELLQTAAKTWLLHLDTIKRVWEVRTTLQWKSTSDSLLDTEDKEILRQLTDDICGSRVQVLWETALENISKTFNDTLNSLLTKIEEEKETSRHDVVPTQFLLSAPPAPSISQASLSVPLAQSSFQRFKLAIKHRIDGITPYIDKIMSEAENSAARLRDDLDATFSDETSRKKFEDSYITCSENTVKILLDTVEKYINEESADSENSLNRLVFLGRIAQKLSFSPLIGSLRCSATFCDNAHVRARSLYNTSVEKCASSVASVAKNKLSANINHKNQERRHNTLPSSPSSNIMEALFFLVDSVQNFGLFRDHTHRAAIVRIVLERFSKEIEFFSTTLECPGATQYLWDLFFLRTICEDWGDVMDEAISSLNNSIKSIQEKLSKEVRDAYPTLSEDFQNSTSLGVRSVRLLLSPLVAPMKQPPPGKQTNTRAEAGLERENTTTMDLVKPSARFGSLWVASAS